MMSMWLGLEAEIVEGWRIRLRKRRQGREMEEKGLKVVRKEVIVRTGTDILAVVLWVGFSEWWVVDLGGRWSG